VKRNRGGKTRNLKDDNVFRQERDFINQRRPEYNKVDDDLVGLAFSGGGIRSATFGLGVLEGLKRCGLLGQIDYLSTVSGGGYIGAWLSGNCKRAADTKPTPENWLYASDEEWDASVTHLRRYSNYLSPELGFFSADTWSMLTIWLRNTILVQLTVILAIAVALLAPRPLFFLFDWWPGAGNWRWTTICLFIFGVVGIAGNLEQGRISLPFRKWWQGLIAAAASGGIAWGVAQAFNFEPFKPGKVEHPYVAIIVALLLVFAAFWLQPAAISVANYCRKEQRKGVNYTQSAVQLAVVLPMMLVGLLVAAILWEQAKTDLAQFDSFGSLFMNAWQYWPLPLTVVFTSLLLLSLCSIHRWSVWVVLAPIAAIVTLHALLCAIVLLLQVWVKGGPEWEMLGFIWIPSFVLYAFSIAIVMLIGMVSRDSPEGVREWWSRFGAWLAIYGAAWMIVSVAAIYSPFWTATLLAKPPWTGISLTGGWVGTTLAGLLAGGSDSTGGKGTKSTVNKALDIVAKLAPFVFIAGLLVAVATVLHYIITLNSGLDMNGRIPPDVTWYLLWRADHLVTAIVLAGCAAALVLMAARVDINQFSLNAFYRNRLVRCYLGATRHPEDRHPQNFTGFDDFDDLKLTELVKPADPGGVSNLGPFHIVNCTLNLGGSSDLSVHTRHSAVFTLTPFYCGSNYAGHNMRGVPEPAMGYVSTAVYGEGGGPTLGQAISVSGAAASPNMGYHTSPVVAFLLTLFNVRLGWWFPNPKKPGINSSSPWFSLRYLIMELFGEAGDSAKYLAISDGGHFENLAAYELIRRKCKVIIISDAESDPDLQFEGLGTLIRMAKVDLDAIVSIDVGAIRPSAGSLWSASRCAVGTIRYADGTTGTLIYLKASMTGHEGTGILQYKSAHPTFPHESTGDQFYREDQFESYRSLGGEIAMETFEPVARSWNLAEDAAKLKELLSPAPPHVSQFTRNSTRLMELWSQMSRNYDLQFLEQELTSNWPADPPTGFRSSFYVCSQMIQLMENVYLELDLEKTWEHADHTGWRAMFELWANSGTLRSVWELTSDSYGLRFRYFCQRHLGLPM